MYEISRREDRGVPDVKDGDRLLTEEKGLGVLMGDVTVLPVAVQGVILEHVGLQKMREHIDH